MRTIIITAIAIVVVIVNAVVIVVIVVIINIPQDYALGVISAPREAATGFPRLCYAYFSFHMTQWDYMTRVMIMVEMIMMMKRTIRIMITMTVMMTMRRWDQKTYKWSVVVRQEPEAGSLIEVL